MTLSQIKVPLCTVRLNATLGEAAGLMVRDSVAALLISSELHGPV